MTHVIYWKGAIAPLQDGPALYELVGEVTAHLGDDT